MKDLPLIDAHAHLDRVGDLTASLQDAKASCVTGVVAVGMDVESNQKTLACAYPSSLVGATLARYPAL